MSKKQDKENRELKLIVVSTMIGAFVSQFLTTVWDEVKEAGSTLSVMIAASIVLIIISFVLYFYLKFIMKIINKL
ncbi:MAG: hypothetical protein KC550_07775 [Nanoarchaeota archaeon]|nr:hypothetical protein [Nanoarchaeota archaeon]